MFDPSHIRLCGQGVGGRRTFCLVAFQREKEPFAARGTEIPTGSQTYYLALKLIANQTTRQRASRASSNLKKKNAKEGHQWACKQPTPLWLRGEMSFTLRHVHGQIGVHKLLAAHTRLRSKLKAASAAGARQPAKLALRRSFWFNTVGPYTLPLLYFPSNLLVDVDHCQAAAAAASVHLPCCILELVIKQKGRSRHDADIYVYLISY